MERIQIFSIDLMLLTCIFIYMPVDSSEVDLKDKHVSEAADLAVGEFLRQYHEQSNTTDLPSMSVLKIVKAYKDAATYKIGFETAPPVECGMFLLEICLPPHYCTAEVSERSQDKMRVRSVYCNAMNSGRNVLPPYEYRRRIGWNQV